MLAGQMTWQLCDATGPERRRVNQLNQRAPRRLPHTGVTGGTLDVEGGAVDAKVTDDQLVAYFGVCAVEMVVPSSEQATPVPPNRSKRAAIHFTPIGRSPIADGERLHAEPGVEARTTAAGTENPRRAGVRVSERGLEPPRDKVSLGPQPSNPSVGK